MINSLRLRPVRSFGLDLRRYSITVAAASFSLSVVLFLFALTSKGATDSFSVTAWLLPEVPRRGDD